MTIYSCGRAGKTFFLKKDYNFKRISVANYLFKTKHHMKFPSPPLVPRETRAQTLHFKRQNKKAAAEREKTRFRNHKSPSIKKRSGREEELNFHWVWKGFFCPCTTTSISHANSPSKNVLYSSSSSSAVDLVNQGTFPHLPRAKKGVEYTPAARSTLLARIPRRNV